MGSANTDFKFSTQTWTDASADALIIGVYQSASKGKRKKKADAGFMMTNALKAVDKAMQGMITTAAEDEKFKGAKSSLLVLRKTPADQLKAKRVILVGLGKQDECDVGRIEKAYLKGFSSVVDLKNTKTLAVVLPNTGAKVNPTDQVQTMVDAAYQSTYRSEESKDKPPGLRSITLLTDKPASAAVKNAVREGVVLAKSRSLVKDLVNKPANIKKTATLAQVAQSIGKKAGVTTRVQANKKWIEKNMPCFYEVAKGSADADQPRFITLTYKPGGGKGKAGKNKRNKKTKKLALVGKSVIFDTGGYQVKTGNYMNTMKGDMTGGACVLGAMQAIAELKPDIEVHAYLAATPNMIDSQAMIPDSIVNTTCGKKVEIRHTDAEGRLTLIDAVSMAAREKPDEMITIATLTGSASVAVGLRIALMGNNHPLRDRVEKAARSLGEPIQPLDVDDDDYDNIKSKLDGADIRNTQKRKGRGAQTAGAFVMSGAPDGLPVAHMDIAGADMTADEKATGIGVKTLVRYILNEAAG